MFERFKNRDRDGDGRADDGGGNVAVRDREDPDDHRHAKRTAAGVAAGGPVGSRVAAHEVRKRQREEFGGINWGSAFFGYLVTVGMAAILTAILAAAGAAIGLTEGVSSSDVNASNADTISLVGGILLLAVLLLAYYFGGYVAGRMSRFDGGRQGIGVWIVGLVIAILLAILGAIGGAKYNVLSQLNLPRIPIDEGTLTTGGVIALIAVVVGTIVAAMFGGKAGEVYHRRVDRVGLGG
jgi:MFS family permease